MEEETNQSSQTLFPHETGHHRSARERQRKGPMWGCLKVIFIGAIVVIALLLLVVGGGYLYVGSSSFEELVAKRIAETLSSRLGRTVTIGRVEILRTGAQRVVLRDLRISNSPGAVNPYFATVREVDITGGINSFWGREIRVDRVAVHDPHLYFEIYPAGSPLTHNFPHWNPGPKGKYEIYRLQIGKLFVDGGQFSFLDRHHDINAVATGLAAETNITLAEGVYDGVATSPRLRVKIQDYEPFDLEMRGGFRYTPGVLALRSIALHGRDMQMFVSGKLDPLTEGAYNLKLSGDVGLNRVREIFRINKVLEGRLTLDTKLRGTAGDFHLAGGWVSTKIDADAYTLTDLKGQMNVTGNQTVIDVNSGRYGGGAISAHYVLPGYAEPYPMTVALRYNGVSIEKLFGDWNIKDTGLRGAATGTLTYGWNKDKVLEGSGSGTATLAKSTTAFSNAKYPIPLAGSADFALNNGVVTLRRTDLTTDASRIGLTGTMRIEDAFVDWNVAIHSTDFSELDRVAYNFAQSAGKKTFNLLGLAGAGDITGTVHGRLKEPAVVAHVASTATKFNNVLLGDATIDLTYDGAKGALNFKPAVFRDGNGTLALNGTISFPDRGPSPRFDLAVDATNYPVERALATIDLKLKLHGLGTGRILVTGTPESGKVTFLGLQMQQKNASLKLTGDVEWLPGKGNVRMNLDINAAQFPVADIAEFLEIEGMPITGDVTGTLHLEGPKNALTGRGNVVVENGVVFGEPVTKATAELTFAEGGVRATNLNVTAPAGQIKGEAEFNFTTNKFSYMITSGTLDVARLKILSTLQGLFGGNLVITSSGGGTADQPELVVEATLNQATMRGLALPADAPAPTLYLAIRNGQLIIKGSAANVLSIEGSGTVGANFVVDGSVRVAITDVAKLLALSPSTATVPISGPVTVDLKLSGPLTSLDKLRIDGTVPELALKIADEVFTPVRPLKFGVREGRFVLDDFQLGAGSNSFRLAGFAGLTGENPLGLRIRGKIEAALLQLFVPGMHADGHINVTADIGGTMKTPRITGSAELQGAQFRFAGFPQLIDNVTGTLVFKGDSISIDSLRATVGGGTIVAGGSIAVNGLMPQSVRLTIQGTSVAIRYFEGLTVEGNFTLVMSGDADRMLLQGDVAVTRALYFKDFNINQALANVLLSRRSVVPVVAASWQDHVSLRVHLDAPVDTLAVRNNIANVTGSATIDLTGTLANPVVLGLVTLTEGGRLRFQNIDYNVVRGSINFQNPFRIDPYFDITLEGRVSGGLQELESGPVDVTVNLVGTLDRFTPTVTSDPPASDITLFSLLGVGNVFNRTSTNPQAPVGAQKAGESLLYSSVGSLIGSKVLPFVENFSVDPGIYETAEDPGPKLTFERRLSNNLRLFVVYYLRDVKTRAALEWQVNNDWTLQFTNDEVRNNERRIEARFRRRYAGRWLMGGNGQPVTMVASASPVEGSISDLPQQTPASGDQPAPSNGPNITEITYRADSQFDTSILNQYVNLRVGDRLSVRAMQGTIKNLFATGDFRDVRVDTTPAQGGVAVTLLLFVNYRIAEVTFDGLGGTTRDRADRESTVHVGDVLSLNAVDRSSTAIHDFLERMGYLDATVDPETTYIRQTSRANVVFHVTPGSRARVASVQIDGPVAPFTTQQLISQMHRGPGSTFTVSDARNDAERMATFMYRRDYRKAEVRFVGHSYDAVSHTAVLKYSATAGPVVRVAVEGVPKSDVRGLLPFMKNQAYSEDTIETAADAITRNYQQHGFYNALVDTESKLENGVWTTTFHIAKGEQFKLSGVTFTGNAKISDEKLKSVTTTAPGGGIRSFFATLFRRPQGITASQLSADRDAIESYYKLQGFTIASVATPVVATNAAHHTMTVDFPITEGPQAIVSAVTIEGNEQVDAGSLPKPALKAGDPLNPAVIREDLLALQNYYSDRGNAEVQITPRYDVSADKSSARVTYVIAEGPKIKIDQTVVRGNTYTDQDVVLKQAGLDRGEPFTYRDILEAQRNLYSLGIFKRVDIQPEQAGTSVGDRNVTIAIEEGKDLLVSGSVGVTKQRDQNISLLGSGSIAHRNLFGTGRYLGLQVILAGRQRQEAYLTYREPFLFDFNIPTELTIYKSDDQLPRAHLVKRGMYIETVKVIGYHTRWSLRYDYKINRCQTDPTKETDLCQQVQDALIPGLDHSITNVKIASVTPNVFWDRRDDPIEPHRGFFTGASIERAFPIFVADANFMKEFGQLSWYHPVSQRSVFAVSTRLGFTQRYGHNTETGEPLLIPLSERFTAGGETSHRAFKLDLLGTTCADPSEQNKGCKPTLIQLKNPDGTPGDFAALGGSAEFLGNVEYRFPIFSTVSGAIFGDVGQVYADSTIDLTQLRYGVGTGLRYISPIGPLRFDVGYNPDPRIIGVDRNGAPIREDRLLYFITFGYAF